MKNTNTIRAIVDTDLGPHIEKIVRTVCIIIVAVYVAGEMTGRWLHSLNDGLASTFSAQYKESRRPEHAEVSIKNSAVTLQPIVQRMAAEVSIKNVAPQTDMDRAVALVISGHSQRSAAKITNVPRSSLQRRLRKM